MNVQRVMSAFVSIHASYSTTLSVSLEQVGRIYCRVSTSLLYGHEYRYGSWTILELGCADVIIVYLVDYIGASIRLFGNFRTSLYGREYRHFVDYIGDSLRLLDKFRTSFC